MNRLFETFVLTPVFATSFVTAADWSSFGGDASNSGTSQGYAPRDLNSAIVKTTANLGIKESSAPVIVNDKAYVYANGRTGMLYCLNSDSLSTEWTAPVMVNDTGFGSWASPAERLSSASSRVSSPSGNEASQGVRPSSANAAVICSSPIESSKRVRLSRTLA